jgi:hypothetical protein
LTTQGETKSTGSMRTDSPLPRRVSSPCVQCWARRYRLGKTSPANRYGSVLRIGGDTPGHPPVGRPPCSAPVTSLRERSGWPGAVAAAEPHRRATVALRADIAQARVCRAKCSTAQRRRHGRSVREGSPLAARKSFDSAVTARVACR